MIFGGRGGYCLEQNMLFRAGLRSLGYQITSLQGRVVRGMAIDAPRPAIHMLLQVDMPEGPYLADVGFGNLAPTSALLLREGVEQATPHEPMRFINVAGELTLQAKLRYVGPYLSRDSVSAIRRRIRDRELVYRHAPRCAVSEQHHCGAPRPQRNAHYNVQ